MQKKNYTKYQLRIHVSIYIPIHGLTVGFDRTLTSFFWIRRNRYELKPVNAYAVESVWFTIHDTCFTILSITNILVTVRIFTSWCQHILSSRIRRTRTITHFLHFSAVGRFNKNHFGQHFPFQFYERHFSTLQTECDIFICDLIVNSIFCVFLVSCFDDNVHVSDGTVFVWIETTT